MKRFTLTSAIVVYIITNTFAQSKTCFGLEFSVANDIYRIDDNGDYLMAVPLINAQGGFIVRQDIKRNIFIETGLIMKYYEEGFGFKTIPYYSSSSSDNSWIIPMRFGLNLNLYKNRIYLAPVVGYSFCINPPFGYGLANGKQTSSTTVIIYNYTENPNVSRYFSLLQTGLGFEFTLFNSLLCSISANYYSGFNRTTLLDINYAVNNSSQTTGRATSKGEFSCVSLGLKYPISHMWTRE